MHENSCLNKFRVDSYAFSTMSPPGSCGPECVMVLHPDGTAAASLAPRACSSRGLFIANCSSLGAHGATPADDKNESSVCAGGGACARRWPLLSYSDTGSALNRKGPRLLCLPSNCPWKSGGAVSKTARGGTGFDSGGGGFLC